MWLLPGALYRLVARKTHPHTRTPREGSVCSNAGDARKRTPPGYTTRYHCSTAWKSHMSLMVLRRNPFVRTSIFERGAARPADCHLQLWLLPLSLTASKTLRVMKSLGLDSNPEASKDHDSWGSASYRILFLSVLLSSVEFLLLCETKSQNPHGPQQDPHGSVVPSSPHHIIASSHHHTITSSIGGGSFLQASSPSPSNRCTTHASLPLTFRKVDACPGGWNRSDAQKLFKHISHRSSHANNEHHERGRMGMQQQQHQGLCAA